MRAKGSGLLMLAAVCAAQQQTGSPAGVPVPPAPSTMPGSPVARQPAGRVFRIRVLDGRNAAPLARARVALWYDEADGEGTLLQTNELGVAAMPRPVGLPVRVLLRPNGLVDCRKQTPNIPMSGYNLKTIAAHGMAAKNSCGAAAVRPEPGELVLFVRPMRWYEGLNR